ncbi:chorismate-binding protein [Plebeiibacterium sediminum]|uniref:Chorismate-binding protein n=1 Tax=Plebeiibacterium sediminum TaxID=2992112 RepID=A0AAE3M7A9_9BACT|nr:chorismate-binding protein [Plebeiobacterium sediminum]MCW3788579.1 chorismate-binding protein [Plebeiobacterium sediminum]
MQKYSQEEVLIKCVQNKVSFSIYRYPGTDKDILLISEDVSAFDKNQLSEFIDKDGYLIAPFSFETNKGVFLKNSILVEGSVEKLSVDHIINAKGQDELATANNLYADYSIYLEQFENLFASIKKGNIQKAILSRVKHIDSFPTQKAVDLYYQLSALYPNAYSFMYYTSYTGLWIGATPELLLQIQHNSVQTVSLAGTKKYDDQEKSWNKKELNEQQYVSDYMDRLLNQYNVVNYKVEGPVSVKAGKLSHLKTIYNFPLDDIAAKVGEFVIDLHPTPAVCGLPKQTSMEVIHSVEGHQRSYYSGFIGKVSKDSLNLYVNIRSLKFVDEGVDLYIGGGITEGSDAKLEWNETELKAGTLLDVINELKNNK